MPNNQKIEGVNISESLQKHLAYSIQSISADQFYTTFHFLHNKTSIFNKRLPA